jgi:hypothetical protein
VIALLSGDDARVVSFSPMLGIDPDLLETALELVARELA